MLRIALILQAIRAAFRAALNDVFWCASLSADMPPGALISRALQDVQQPRSIQRLKVLRLASQLSGPLDTFGQEAPHCLRACHAGIHPVEPIFNLGQLLTAGGDKVQQAMGAEILGSTSRPLAIWCTAAHDFCCFRQIKWKRSRR